MLDTTSALPESVTFGSAVSWNQLADPAPNNYAKQVIVYFTGTGALANVSPHTVSKPFTLTAFRPAILRTLGSANPVTGILKDFPNNSYKVVTRKGVLVAANNPPKLAIIRTSLEIPAGAESYSPDDVKAAISSHIAWLTKNGATLFALTQTGSM